MLKSSKSLKYVRRAHYLASKNGVEKNIGPITQPMVSLTTFGFMGFPLIYPHTMGIVDATIENEEGFVHFWAIICYMLGVKDEYNMCLLPLPAVKIVLKFFLRHIILPQMQIESPLNKQMLDAMFEGLRKVMPLRDTTVYLSLAKIYCQVPGYNVFISPKDTPLHRLLFDQYELDMMYQAVHEEQPHFPMTTKLPVIRILDEPDMLQNNNDLYTPDYKYVQDTMEIEDIRRISIEYKTADAQGNFSVDRELFDNLDFFLRWKIRLLFTLKKVYYSSELFQKLLDKLMDKIMNRIYGSDCMLKQ